MEETKDELVAVCFWNLCYLGYGRDSDEVCQTEKKTFRDLVGKTFVGSSGVMYQYEYPNIQSKEEYQRWIAAMKINPTHNLEGVAYYPTKINAEEAIASLNGSMVNGQRFSVALRK